MSSCFKDMMGWGDGRRRELCEVNVIGISEASNTVGVLGSESVGLTSFMGLKKILGRTPNRGNQRGLQFCNIKEII